ncbi:unnamed protein product [Rhizophagus irregularis]|nr:unnamed protein product [Rhizophagus irregularis]
MKVGESTIYIYKGGFKVKPRKLEIRKEFLKSKYNKNLEDTTKKIKYMNENWNNNITDVANNNAIETLFQIECSNLNSKEILTNSTEKDKILLEILEKIELGRNITIIWRNESNFLKKEEIKGHDIIESGCKRNGNTKQSSENNIMKKRKFK